MAGSNVAQHRLGKVCIAALVGVTVSTIPAGNCGLSQLHIWAGEKTLRLRPSFSTDVLEYSADLDNKAIGLWVDPVPTSSTCEARRSDSTESILPGQSGMLAVTVRSISSQVTTEYTVSVTRLVGDDSTLRQLYIKGAQMIPSFQPQVHEYSVFPIPQEPVVLVGDPTDSGERLEIVSISPPSELRPQYPATFSTKAAGQTSRWFGHKGARNIALGSLRLGAGGVRVLRLPSSMRSENVKDIALPARVVLRAWPSVEHLDHQMMTRIAPTTYTLVLNAPRRAAFTMKFAKHDSALAILTLAASRLDQAAQWAAGQVAAKIAAQAAAAAAAATTTTMQSTVPPTTPLPTAAPIPLTTLAAAPPAPVPAPAPAPTAALAAAPPAATPPVAAPIPIAAPLAPSQPASTTPKEALPDWAVAQHDSETGEAREGHFKKTLNTTPLVIGLTIVLTLLVLLFVCRKRSHGGRPVWVQCRSWLQGEMDARETTTAASERHPAQEPGNSATPGYVEDAAMMRALVLAG